MARWCDSARLVPHGRLEVVATRPDGGLLGDKEGAGPARLVLTRTARGAEADVWRAERAFLSGAPENVGLATVMLDFASDVVGLTLARDEVAGLDEDEARRHHDLWRVYRGTYGPTDFFDADGERPDAWQAARPSADPVQREAPIRRLWHRLRRHLDRRTR